MRRRGIDRYRLNEQQSKAGRRITEKGNNLNFHRTVACNFPARSAVSLSHLPFCLACLFDACVYGFLGLGVSCSPACNLHLIFTALTPLSLQSIPVRASDARRIVCAPWVVCSSLEGHRLPLCSPHHHSAILWIILPHFSKPVSPCSAFLGPIILGGVSGMLKPSAYAARRTEFGKQIQLFFQSRWRSVCDNLTVICLQTVLPDGNNSNILLCVCLCLCWCDWLVALKSKGFVVSLLKWPNYCTNIWPLLKWWILHSTVVEINVHIW